MAKFKVGDRVRCTNVDKSDDRLTAGNVYVVGGYDVHGFVLPVGVNPRPCGFFEHRFVLDNLKLEKGATVRLKDGVDEWVVEGDGTWNRLVISRGSARFVIHESDLVVVKEKPEPPAEYGNAKGPRLPGDVYRVRYDNGDKTCWLVEQDGAFRNLSQDYAFPYDTTTQMGTDRRTLLVRDGKPYTG